MIYLDSAATTKVCDAAIDAAERYMRCDYYNPAASYAQKMREDLQSARTAVAAALGCTSQDLYFMSCASEANNLILRGALKKVGQRIIISEGEHASVYNTAMSLKSRYKVELCPLKADGSVNAERLINAVDADTGLVMLIHVSNETGAINDIAALCAAVKKKNNTCMFAVDGVQALTKIAIYASDWGTDFYSVSAHKVNGVKGVGALYVRKGITVNPLISGGGQESGLRSGTENTVGIMAFAAALQDSGGTAGVAQHWERAKKINRSLREGLADIPELRINSPETGSPYILSLSFVGHKAEVLTRRLFERGLAVGLGSACSSKHSDNRTLRSMGKDKMSIEGNIRLSFDRFFTETEAEAAVRIIRETVFNKTKLP